MWRLRSFVVDVNMKINTSRFSDSSIENKI